MKTREQWSVSSARQRIIVVTFDTVEEAERWDANGQPIDDLRSYGTKS